MTLLQRVLAFLRGPEGVSLVARVRAWFQSRKNPTP
jgi:hypothetical protein